MTDYNTPENNNESFVRWQQVSIDERGKTINLFLGMSFATIGFIITQLSGKEFEFKNCSTEWLIGIGSCLLLLCITTFILLVLNRLEDFRITTQIAKLSHIKENGAIDTLRTESEAIGKKTHRLFRAALVLFAIGESLIVIGFMTQVLDKF